MVKQEKDDGWIHLSITASVKFTSYGMFLYNPITNALLDFDEQEKIKLYHLISENMEGRLIGQG